MTEREREEKNKKESSKQKELEAERFYEIGCRILRAAGNELYVRMRFLDVALSGFTFQMDTEVKTAGTDGLIIYFNVRDLGGWYREDRTMVNRLYLHMVLHCIFRHMLKKGRRKEELFSLACDIVIESVIDSLDLRNVRRGRSLLRREIYRHMEQKMRVLTAEKVYSELEKMELEEKTVRELQEEFTVDDHCFWKNSEDPQRRSEIQNRWEEVSEQTQTEMETFAKESTSDAGDLLEQMQVENRERYDYREFLRKFSVLREEIGVDEDSFDYSFYSYGLRLYGNLPLIEPQEWKEVKKVEEFVIVVDTSMSCSGELVKKFLEETYSILREQESFFRKVKIHIIQCDEKVQEDIRIIEEKELTDYMEHLELKGGGGTDFRPAFEYIASLFAQGEFEQLRGVLYFTDGQGIYPEKKPPYDTAFVFMQEDYKDVDVPPWAMKLIIEEEEMKEQEEEPLWTSNVQNRK